MTPVANDRRKSFVPIPKGKNLNMSYEETIREMEAYLDGDVNKSRTSHEAHVDVTEVTNSSALKLPEALDPNATDVSSENSSSFGDTTPRSEVTSVTSDVEVESEFRAETGLGSMYNGYSGAFPMRKNKLTPHWRNFVRPLMWRCKWTELKIRELESQALKYTRELEQTDQTKISELQQSSDLGSKSFPFSLHSVRTTAMKRRKRKLVENVTDVSSYMSHHHLFSYLEDKKSDPDDAVTTEDDCDKEQYSKNGEDGVMSDDWLKHDEDSMEEILRQIGTVESQVLRLKNHLNTVMLKNCVKLSSSENLTLLSLEDGQTSAAQSPTFSVGNGDMYIDDLYTSHNLPDFDLEDLVVPESTVSDYVGGSQIPDVIETTAGFFSVADIAVDQPQILESAENVLDNILIQTNIHIRREQKVPDLVVGDETSPEKSTLRSCITSDAPTMNKRKRGERKAAPGGWNLICSGDPDNI